MANNHCDIVIAENHFHSVLLDTEKENKINYRSGTHWVTSRLKTKSDSFVLISSLAQDPMSVMMEEVLYCLPTLANTASRGV